MIGPVLIKFLVKLFFFIIVTSILLQRALCMDNTLLTQIGNVSVITEIQPLLIEYTKLCIAHQVKLSRSSLFVGDDDDDLLVKRNLRK